MRIWRRQIDKFVKIIFIIAIITSVTKGGQRLCFNPRLSVCLFSCVQDIPKSCGQIRMKLVDTGVRRGRIDSFLVKIRIQIREFYLIF